MQNVEYFPISHHQFTVVYIGGDNEIPSYEDVIKVKDFVDINNDWISKIEDIKNIINMSIKIESCNEGSLKEKYYLAIFSKHYYSASDIDEWSLALKDIDKGPYTLFVWGNYKITRINEFYMPFA